MEGRVRIGCSGYDYDSWEGPFYPVGLPRSRRLSQYAEQFDTVELNSTFYRLPTTAAVDRWARSVPDGFSFAVKVGQYASHRKKLLDAESWLPRHVDRTAGLGDRLGPELLQLPPRWRRNVPRLEAVLAAVPRRRRWAVEVRDPSWLHDDVLAALAAHDAALCIHDLLPGHPWERTASWVYVRFHGPHAPDRPYAERYGLRRLARAADRLGSWLADGTDVYAYFNNDQEAAAPADARDLRALLSS